VSWWGLRLLGYSQGGLRVVLTRGGGLLVVVFGEGLVEGLVMCGCIGG